MLTLFEISTTEGPHGFRFRVLGVEGLGVQAQGLGGREATSYGLEEFGGFRLRDLG